MWRRPDTGEESHKIRGEDLKTAFTSHNLTTGEFSSQLKFEKNTEHKKPSRIICFQCFQKIGHTFKTEKKKKKKPVTDFRISKNQVVLCMRRVGWNKRICSKNDSFYKIPKYETIGSKIPSMSSAQWLIFWKNQKQLKPEVLTPLMDNWPSEKPCKPGAWCLKRQSQDRCFTWLAGSYPHTACLGEPQASTAGFPSSAKVSAREGRSCLDSLLEFFWRWKACEGTQKENIRMKRLAGVIARS